MTTINDGNSIPPFSSPPQREPIAKPRTVVRGKYPTDALQLSNLSSLLNSLESAATGGRQKLNEVSTLVRDGGYLVDATAIGQRLIAEAITG